MSAAARLPPAAVLLAVCACGCGRLVTPGKGATHPACRKRQERDRNSERYGYRTARASEFEPEQPPTMPDALVRRYEARLRELSTLQGLLESDDTLIGRTLSGRVGTSMGGKGGILPWAEPIYRAHRKQRERVELRGAP